MNINIANLYPDILNMYGDKGNIQSLFYRMEKRGIDVTIKEYMPGEKIDFDSVDIIYIGGGTEKDQLTALKSLEVQKNELKEYAQNDGCIIGVCSGYELLGKSFYADGKKVEATQVLNIDFKSKPERMIGDVIIESDVIGTVIAGFENHSGCVSENEYAPLGKVVCGYGTDGEGVYEGTIYKNVIGTYVHGPLLPLNPQLADYIISVVAEKKDKSFELVPIEDEYENLARSYVISKVK